jgi:hypothetical protein
MFSYMEEAFDFVTSKMAKNSKYFLFHLDWRGVEFDYGV